MLDHISLGVTHLGRSARFYDAVLKPLGYERVWSYDDAAGYGTPGADDAFAIKREASMSVSSGSRLHVAFAARTRQAVIDFHELAVSLGATSDGAPELHPMYGDGYFAAFVFDPDGYRLEAVCHEPVIRERAERNIDGCVAALKRVHKIDGYPSSWPANPRSWLMPEGLLRAWVARIGSSVVGHVAVGEVDPAESPHFVGRGSGGARNVEVKRLFVLPDARGLGIGKALLETAVAFATAEARRPVLEVTADRRAAVQLYERAGWQRIGTAPAGWVRASGERPLVHHYVWP